jgi:hypothetical protein
MKKSNRLSLRLQIRSFKNTFFQFNDLPFKDLLPDSLIEAIHQSGDVRNTVFTPLVTLRAFLFPKSGVRSFNATLIVITKKSTR